MLRVWGKYKVREVARIYRRQQILEKHLHHAVIWLWQILIREHYVNRIITFLFSKECNRVSHTSCPTVSYSCWNSCSEMDYKKPCSRQTGRPKKCWFPGGMKWLPKQMLGSLKMVKMLITRREVDLKMGRRCGLPRSASVVFSRDTTSWID